MTSDKNLLSILGYIATLPAEDQIKCNECVAKVQAVLDEYPEQAYAVIGFIGISMQVARERQEDHG